MSARVRLTVALGLAALAFSACGSENDDSATSAGSAAGDISSFFEGKTVQVIVTHSAGGGSDIYGRFVAGKLSDALPGHPRVSVTNVDGIGGVDTVFNAKEGDLVVGVSARGSLEYQTVLDPAGAIDAAKVQIIGASAGDTQGFAVFGDAAEAYGDDITKAFGSSGPALRWAEVVGQPSDVLSNAYMVSWMCDSLELPCEMATVASDDGSDLDLMLQRGETNMTLGTMPAMLREYAGDVLEGKAAYAWSFAEKPGAELTPPDGIEYSDIETFLAEEQKAEYEQILPIISTGAVGRHFWAGPGLSPDVVGALRDAYDEVTTDPANLKELTGLLVGDDDAQFTYVPGIFTGEEAQQTYDEETKSFNENLDFYKEKQQEYFDEFWK